MLGMLVWGPGSRVMCFVAVDGQGAQGGMLVGLVDMYRIQDYNGDQVSVAPFGALSSHTPGESVLLGFADIVCNLQSATSMILVPVQVQV